MKGKAVIPLVLGLGMGLLAIKLGIGAMRRAQGKPVETVNVVVAARQIDAAAAIDDKMLKLAPVPVGLIPPGSFQDLKRLIGRVPLMPIATGIPVSAEMLAPEGAEPGLPSQIPDGYRAVSVGVDESTAVAGFVMPGHRVDVYANDLVVRGPGGNRTVSRLLLEDVLVGAVGQSIKTVDPDGKASRLTRSVTLYIRPEDVPSLDSASRSSIRLALRGSGDHAKAPKQARTSLGDGLAALLNSLPKSTPPAQQPAAASQPVVAVAKPQKFVVELYKGEALERIVFAGPNSSQRRDTADKGSKAQDDGTEPNASHSEPDAGTQENHE